MTTDGDPVDLTSALEQLWGARRGPVPPPPASPRVPEPAAVATETPPPASPPGPAVDEGVAELRADIDALRTQLLTALEEHEARRRDDARERVARPLAAAAPTAEADVDVDVEDEVVERVDEVAAQVTGLAERFAGLERLVETAMAEGVKRETNLDRGRARLRTTMDELNGRVAGLAERFAGLEGVVESAVAQRSQPEPHSDSASARLEEAMDGFDAVVAGLDAAVAGLASGVTERLAGVAADVVRDATLAPLRRELRGAKADIAGVRKAVAELQADVSSLRSMATVPAVKVTRAAPAKKAPAPRKKTVAPAKKAGPRRPVDVAPAVEDESEVIERPPRSSGSRRPFRGEFATWEEDESVGRDTSASTTDEAGARDRRRQILAEAARSAAEGGDLDLDELFTVTEPGPGSPEGDAGERASKRSRFSSRRHRS